MCEMTSPGCQWAPTERFRPANLLPPFGAAGGFHMPISNFFNQGTIGYVSILGGFEARQFLLIVKLDLLSLTIPQTV
jgi:hypothetical protein